MFYEVEKMSQSVSFEELDSMLTFAMNYLDFDTDIPVIVTFDLEGAESLGYADVDEDEITLAISPSLSGEELVRTVFHELVHANQIIKGVYDPYESTWNGSVYTGNYWDLPWEKEAYALEETMYGEYVKTTVI